MSPAPFTKWVCQGLKGSGEKFTVVFSHPDEIIAVSMNYAFLGNMSLFMKHFVLCK